MNQIAAVFIVIVVVVALFVWNKIPVVIVSIATPLALYALGILNLGETVVGFGDAAVIFIATLFVVSEGLDATGVTAWAGRFLIAKAGASRTRLLVIIIALVSLMTALISVNGAVAALLPMVVVIAIRLNIPASKLLMPLVFGAHAASLLTLTGTPVNVIVSDAALNAGGRPFGYFEFALVGVPLLLGTMAILILFGDRLLPHRTSPTIWRDLSEHARTLVEEYALEDGVFRLRVRPHSPYVGLSPSSIDVKDYPGLTLVSVQVAEEPYFTTPLVAAGDFVIVSGEAKAARNLAADKILGFRSEQAAADVGEALVNRNSGLGELVIPPRSGLIGRPVFPGMVTSGGELVILAVQRRGENQVGETVLAAGDTLLLQGTWEALDEGLDDPDVLVVDSPEILRRQAVPLGRGAKQAIAVLAGMIIVVAFDLMPAVIAGLIAACLMVLLGVLTVQQAYRSINWTTIILVGAMMPLSTAISKTGAARLLADGVVAVVGAAGPHALLAGLFVITALLGQLISNMATALIVIPIGLAAAAQAGISPMPVLMNVAVAGAASFLTPIATPVNLIVKGPAGYHFGDYWKLGLPLLGWFLLVSTFLVPVFWRF
ncbi:MAG: SLC13 family permease [Bryobacterales bacterium]|nr:SLC13 family permease [Bryobacterales bacterium]MBV9399492.1 SLC13 family permease [Bryobacterales bacterium]